MRFVYTATSFCLALLLAGCGPAAKEPASKPSPGNAAAPEAAAGNPEVRLIPVSEVSSLLPAPEGGLTVVNLWATWCPPCVAEMPELATFYRDTDRDLIRFVSLSYDAPDNLAKVREFHESKDLPFAVYVLDEMDRPEDIDDALGTVFGGALPTTFIYDQQGKVVQTWEGAITGEMLQKRVNALL